MFQAVFSYSIRSDLVVCEGDLKAARGRFIVRRYVQVLEEHLRTVLNADSIFIQDNTRIHIAHVMIDQLKENGIKVIDWPLYSLDLNLIKNIQALLKKKIYKLEPSLITRSDSTMLSLLYKTAIRAWELLLEELLNNLTLEMENRYKAVIKVDGWYTKY